MLHQCVKLKKQTEGNMFITLWGSLLTLDSHITIQLNEESSCNFAKRTSPNPCTPSPFFDLVYPNNDSKNRKHQKNMGRKYS